MTHQVWVAGGGWAGDGLLKRRSLERQPVACYAGEIEHRLLADLTLDNRVHTHKQDVILRHVLGDNLHGTGAVNRRVIVGRHVYDGD